MILNLCVATISYFLRGSKYLILDSAGTFFYRPDLNSSHGNHGSFPFSLLGYCSLLKFCVAVFYVK